MQNPKVAFEDSLEFEIRLTARVLTHKLSGWSFANYKKSSTSAFRELPSFDRRIPDFPLTELWWILNSINNNGNLLSCSISKPCAETNSGVCVTHDDRSAAGSEEGPQFTKEWVVPGAPSPTNSEHCENPVTAPEEPPNDLTTLQQTVEEAQRKAQKYEKKNIYYKAVFRDIRKYFIEMLNVSTDYSSLKRQNKYKAYEPSINQLITNLLSTESEGASPQEIREMVKVLAAFLNYNDFLVSFKDKNEKDAQSVLDWLQNFTLTKMKKVLQFPIIRFIVLYYYKHTVVDGSSGKPSIRLAPQS